MMNHESQNTVGGLAIFLNLFRYFIYTDYVLAQVASFHHKPVQCIQFVSTRSS